MKGFQEGNSFYHTCLLSMINSLLRPLEHGAIMEQQPAVIRLWSNRSLLRAK
jgi:hypothetical protein